MPVSHHGTVQGDRNLAQPLTTKVRISAEAAEGTLPLGFRGTTEVPLHASTRLSFAQQKAVQNVEFTAPSLLSYKFTVAAGDACALFYPIPVARGRSRVLVRRARNFATGRVMSTAALVAKHLENNIVFDQDMAFLRGQEARLQAIEPDGYGGAWRASALSGSTGYVMPAECDKFVISFRKQLDRVAQKLPWRSAPSAASAHAPALPRRTLLDRYEQHTKHCAVCLAALALTERCAQVATLTAQLSAMAALVALASAGAPSPRFLVLCAASAAAFSASLLKAYVVGPVVGAVPNRLVAAPLAAAAVALAVAALRPAGLLAHACSVLLPLSTAACAVASARALDVLRARFIYTEEAKALQIS